MELLSPTNNNLLIAADALKKGALVAFPTETVYGLGGDAFNNLTLAGIFKVKKRPRFDPLIIHIADHSMLGSIVDEDALRTNVKARLKKIIDKFWPGPLTLVLPKKKEVPDLATAGLATAAIRFPSHPLAAKLIRLSTGALAAPSANPFGYISPTKAEHVVKQLGDSIDYIIDGGKTDFGIESTVLDLCRDIPMVLRPGAVSLEELEEQIGKVELFNGKAAEPENASPTTSPAPAAPGMLKSHYAPHTRIILHKEGELSLLPHSPGEGRLYFRTPPEPANVTLKANSAPAEPANVTLTKTPAEPENASLTAPAAKILSPSGDLLEAAANLFECLHELDSLGLKLLRAEMAPNTGLGLAINDRLTRAAASENKED